MRSLRSIIDETLWSLFPGRCRLCEGTTYQQLDLCEVCRADLPKARWSCRRCALPLPFDASECGQCLRRPPPFQRTLTALLYQQETRELIADIKFRQQLSSLRTLALLLSEAIDSGYYNDDFPMLITAVPLAWQRALQRGHDQASLLAYRLRHQLRLHYGRNVSVSTGLIKRARHTPPQSELTTRAERRRNIRDAFLVTSTKVPEHIALVDDVMTTGATLEEATRMLLRAGCKRVDVWVAARTPIRRGARRIPL